MATTGETGGVINDDADDNIIDVMDDADDAAQASDQPGPPKKKAAKSQRKRVVWAKRESTTKSVNGSQKISYPFLDNDNYHDVYLVRVLLAMAPFKAEYGQTIKAWDAAAACLCTHLDPSGKLVFPDGITTRTMKTRFEDSIQFVKKYDGNLPFHSGEDDEAELNEMQSGLEDIYEDWCSFEASKQATSNSNAVQIKLEKEQAEQIRKGSVGEMSRAELQKTLASTALTTPAVASKNKSGYLSSGSATSSGCGAPSHELDQIKSQLLNRVQANEDAFGSVDDRASRKKQNLDLLQWRVNQEQQRLDLVKLCIANEQQRLANEHQQSTQQMKLNKLMMKSILESQTSQGKNNKRGDGDL
jgi:hypothetical protein